MLAPVFSLYPPKSMNSPPYTLLPKQRILSPPCSQPLRPSTNSRIQTRKPSLCCAMRNDRAIIVAFLGAGLGLTVVGPSSAVELPLLGFSLQLNEPSNALSLPTWVVHVSSVVEWVTAMALVWQYGERPGCESWKGLSWGMVPLLGGAFCACTWHFFYNSESLQVLVALQAALTVIGNATMCIAAFRIYKSQDHSETS